MSRQQWSCTVCTFFNDIGVTCCEMCDTISDIPVAVAVSPASLTSRSPPEIKQSKDMLPDSTDDVSLYPHDPQRSAVSFKSNLQPRTVYCEPISPETSSERSCSSDSSSDHFGQHGADEEQSIQNELLLSLLSQVEGLKSELKELKASPSATPSKHIEMYPVGKELVRSRVNPFAEGSPAFRLYDMGYERKLVEDSLLRDSTFDGALAWILDFQERADVLSLCKDSQVYGGSPAHCFSSDLDSSDNDELLETEGQTFVDPFASLGAKSHVTCMVLGETGSGKSTVINTLTNYFMSGDPSSLKVSIPTKFHKQNVRGSHSERDPSDQSQSMTNDCTTYTFRDPRGSGRVIEIIDTPGLADTRGAKQDEINMDLILKAAEKAKSLTSIILVVNGGVARELLSIQSCMTKLRGYLPDVFKKHTLVVFTHCQVPSKCIFDKKKLPFAPIAEKNMFYMENSMFSIDPREYSTLEKDEKRLYEFEWKKAIKSMERLVVRMTELGDSLTSSLVQVRKSRDELKAALCNMKLQMVGLQNAQDELDNIEKMMKQAEGDKTQFAQFTKTNHITEKKMVDVPYHSTICGECNHVCHQQCGLDEIAEKGSHKFTRCAAFNGNDSCRSCPGKCSYKLHFHDKKNIVEETKTVEEVLDDIKQKYDLATQQYDDAGRKLTGMQSARQSVDQAIQKLKNNVEAACHNIKEHCSHFNLAQELAVMIQQLEHEKGMLRNVSAIQTADQFISSIRDLADTLSGQRMSSRSCGARSSQPQDSFFSGLGVGTRSKPAAVNLTGTSSQLWSCGTCTLKNEPANENCDACGFGRPEKRNKSYFSKLKGSMYDIFG